jgi:putative polyketide hydroxylase
MQCDGEPPRGAWMRAAHAALEVRNASLTHCGTLGQFRLRQADAEPMPLQEFSEVARFFEHGHICLAVAQRTTHGFDITARGGQCNHDCVGSACMALVAHYPTPRNTGAVAMPEADVPVLIVGGGPTGLSAALVLSRHGVRWLLLERHPGTSVHPKARGLNVRTLELLRLWGLEPAVRAAGSELNRALDLVWAPTLVSPETRRIPYGGAGERHATDSPTTSAGCTQDKLERILLEAARSYTVGELHFCQEVTGLSPDGDTVRATVLDRTSGEETTVRANWVIAADGAQSPVRSMLGIRMQGPGALFHRMGIYFRADLREIGASRPAFGYLVSPPEGSGPIAAVNLADLWLFMAPFRPEQGERAEDFSEERCVRLVRSAVGIEDLEVEVLSALPWSGAAAIAERFRHGRIFLAGDAAHLIPPNGGQAMNVGIQDVHNLAWKLAAQLNSWADVSLLDTYESERRAFALAVNEDVVQNIAAEPDGIRLEQFSNRGRVLGVSYDSSAVIADGTHLPTVPNPVVEYVPTARPGSRAPHMWLQRGDQQISTLDLYDTHFVLLTGPAGEAWGTAGQRIADFLGIPLRCYVVGPNGPLIDRTGEWQKLYGVGLQGAVLVRPDGHVAWRMPDADSNPETALAAAFCRILSLDSATVQK